MKNKINLLLAGVMALFLGGGSDRPLVVATTSVLCNLTEQIAKETIELQCLVQPGDDPHLYQAKPEDRKAIETAQLILYAGYDFDVSLTKLIEASSNQGVKIPIHEQAVPNPIITQEESGQTTVDPHVWHDPENGMAMVNLIAESLKQLAPNHSQLYDNRKTEILNDLKNLDRWIQEQIETIPPQQRKIVTTHDALGYYIQAYNLEFEGALSGLSTDEQPTAARIKELVEAIKKAQVPTIFAQTTINPRLIQTVALEANVLVSSRPLYADGLGEQGTEGETYQGMLQANTRTIVEGLGGKYRPIQQNK